LTHFIALNASSAIVLSFCKLFLLLCLIFESLIFFVDARASAIDQSPAEREVYPHIRLMIAFIAVHQTVLALMHWPAHQH
jgi:hypothetical protein